MKTIILIALTCFGLGLAGCGGLTKGKVAAETAIAFFHEQYNEGKLDAIWDGAHPKFRSASKKGKVVMRDGTEIPVEVLLKDTTLDLIVLRADSKAWQKAGGDKLASVDLTKGGDAELLDTVLAIGISGPSLGREIVAAPSGIMVKVVKPRLIYRPSFAQKGGPAFLLDGRLLGIGAQHVYHDKLTNDPIVVPTEDVADLVRQALAGKPAQP